MVRCVDGSLTSVALFKKPKSPYWWLDITPRDGRPRVRQSTGVRHDAATAELRKQNRHLAEIKLHEKYTELATSHIIGKEPGPKLTPITMKDYGAWYAEHHSAHNRGGDREMYRIAKFVKQWGSRQLASLTPQDIQEFLSSRLKVVKPLTVREDASQLRRMLKRAIPKYLNSSPMEGLKLPKGVSRPRFVLSKADEGKLLPHLEPVDRVLVMAAIDTLARAGDLLDLTWADDRGSHFTIADPKNGQPYQVPISTRVRTALDALRNGAPRTARIFPRETTAKRLSKGLPYMLQVACKKAGIKYGRQNDAFDFHGLRHTGATRFLEAGGSIRELQALGGWKDLRHLTLYTHPDRDAIQRTVDRMSQGVAESVPRTRPSASDKRPPSSRQNTQKRAVH